MRAIFDPEWQSWTWPDGVVIHDDQITTAERDVLNEFQIRWFYHISGHPPSTCGLLDNLREAVRRAKRVPHRVMTERLLRYAHRRVDYDPNLGDETLADWDALLHTGMLKPAVPPKFAAAGIAGHGDA